MFQKPIKHTAIAFAVTAALTGCKSSDSTSERDDDVNLTPHSVKVGLLPDTQGGGWNVAVHPMEAVLAKHKEEGVNVVIPVGDLTDNGSTHEWEQWVGVASKYRDAGIEFLPVMGNHETSWAYTVEWIENMRHFIPEDAIHMPSAEWLNYYVVRDNVLMIGLAYYNLPIAFGWIQDVLADNEGNFDHVVIASHDGLIGAKYGETREQIVEGVKDDNRLFDIHKEIRETFAEHDVIWVQGHEHMYQRSQIHARVLGSNDPGGRSTVDTLASTPSGGNYRMPSYTQIISGNASYKGYEYRYGERELIQDVVQHKMATYDTGMDSHHYDANAAILTFSGQRVDYHAYYAPHTIKNNEEGPKELADPEWTLMDTFSRTLERCETLVYPNSIPEGQRPILNHIVEYKTADCMGSNGESAKLVGGTNNTFNRVDTTERTLGFHEGLKRAESMNDLTRLSYQFLFTKNSSWDPNLNAANRLLPGENGEDDFGSRKGNVIIPATTIDMKKHVTLSWETKDANTESDILIVSGMQNHGGTYQNSHGGEKDLTSDTGMDGSQPDGTAKGPHDLPYSATQDWDSTKIIGDNYGIEFKAGNNIQDHNVILGQRINGKWSPITPAHCVIDLPWDEDFANNPPQLPSSNCSDYPVVGYDSNYGNLWWTIVNKDVEVSLIRR
ncbi:metallophosphoesterase [uncultured Vibrio sp.]|uniref:metallophosphoesterase family protein n=1 Tax=uncultured Vibrio sp. TaxID=114054 RepID=UPI000B312B2C|nr:metallophosphoesterase [uncultured Vibrio sp.]